MFGRWMVALAASLLIPAAVQAEDASALVARFKDASGGAAWDNVRTLHAAGTLGAGELESMCHLAAQRLSLLYAPAAPEFFDKSLFRGFIQKLKEMRLVWPDDKSKLMFDERLSAWARDAKVILGRELRHTIEKISPEAQQGDAARN